MKLWQIIKKAGQLMTLILIILLAGDIKCFPAFAAEITTFTARAPESDSDQRKDYENALLELALEKTREKWGDYRLIYAPRMNWKRTFHSMASGKFENPMFNTSANDELCSKFSYVNFPTDLGIVGYRVFFTSPEINKRTAGVKKFEDLVKFSIGQMVGWVDIPILRHAGFKVVEAPEYESLFMMTSHNRFDLFSRGINEIKKEKTAHRHLKNLIVEEHLALYYPLPRFFFTTKGNVKAVQRVTEGLRAAYADGSLHDLWERHYKDSINFVHFSNRKLFRIENPYIQNIEKTYEKYLYKMPEMRKEAQRTD
nr:hypothetical protein [Maridesulfovibrio sp.]